MVKVKHKGRVYSKWRLVGFKEADRGNLMLNDLAFTAQTIHCANIVTCTV